MHCKNRPYQEARVGVFAELFGPGIYVTGRFRMRHPIKPWYRSLNDTWYVQLRGKQVPLAQGRDNSKEAYRRLYHDGP